MLSNLFVNGCILITVIFIAVEFLESDKVRNCSKNIKPFISGIAFSISSTLLILYNISVTPTAFLDFRTISQASSAFYGGPISSIITGLVASLFRLFYFGVSKRSILTFISMIISSLLCAYIAKKDFSKKLKWLLLVMVSNIVHIILFFLVIEDSKDIVRVIIYLLIGTAFVATIIYFVFDHLLLAHKQVEKLKQQASIDFLTGVHNTRNFRSLYNESVEKLKESDDVFSVLMIDIDFFKKVNDTYGHPVGDQVLRDLGYVLNLFCREDGIVGRVGGEEFCILLEYYSNNEAFEFAENLRKYIEKTQIIISSKEQISIKVSIGISTYKETVPNVENMLKVADEKLYEAKNTGRNRVCT